MHETARPRAHRPIRGFLSVAVTVALALAATALTAGPAEAGVMDPNIVVQLTPLEPSLPASMTIAPTGELLSVSGISVDEVPAQCVPTNDGQQTCLGTNGGFQIESTSTTNRFFLDPEANSALSWIVPEAIVAVAGLNGVAADGRVEQYARADIRAYINKRLLSIIDSASYGIPLTTNEQKALVFLQNQVLRDDRIMAAAAVTEYKRFMAEGCAYVPPSAPAFVANPVPVPGSLVTGCKGNIGLGSVWSPPIPSVSEFQAWGFYRVAADLGMGPLSNPEVQVNINNSIRAGVLGAGIVAAVGVGAITYAAVGASAGTASAIAGAFGGVWSGAVFGAAVPAAIIAVVIFAVVAAGLSIWQLVETQQIGTTLTTKSAQADEATDPFGLAALQTANAGRSLDADRETWVDEASKPLYRRDKGVVRLSEYIARWTMVRPESGTVRSDPQGLWPGNATTGDDYQFRVTDGNGTVTVAEEITVLTSSGPATARISDGWFIITPAGGQPRAALNLEYIDAPGVQSFATRQPVPDTEDDQRFSVTRFPSGASTTEDQIAYQKPGGGFAEAAIIPPPGEVAAEARPTVSGSFLPQRTHTLRPNAINTDGDVDDVEFANNYDATWEVQRFDETSGAWVNDTPVTPQASSGDPTWGGSFTPTTTGRYRAGVTLEHTEGNLPDVTGTVELTVVAPPIQILSATVTDHHLTSELEVTVQATEPVASDDITVAVTWPGDVDSDEPGPTTQTTVPCATGFPCATVPVTLTHPIDPLTDLEGDVTITLTNSHGGQVSRVVPITTPARPSFVAPPVAPGPDQPGVVTFDPHRIHVQLPAGVGGNGNYVVAGIAPGAGAVDPTFILTNPDDPGLPMAAIDVRGDGTFLVSVEDEGDEQVINLRGVPRVEDIGTYEVPILLQQDNGALRSTTLLIDVVPAANDRFRAGLLSEVDPLDFVEDGPPQAEVRLLGGRDEWGPYTGDVCVSLADGFGSTDHCGPVDEFFEADGTPRPFPYAKVAPNGLESGTGTITISAWLPDDAHTFDEPTSASFVIGNGTAPPRITQLSWNNTTGAATLAVTPGSSTIQSVTCSIDGSPLPSCFDPSGGSWTPPALAPGPHDLQVVVVDGQANYDSAGLTIGAPNPIATPANAVVAEGDGGQTILRVPVTLSQPVAQEVTLEYSTLHVAGLAFPQGTPGEDHEATTGFVTFAPGEVTAEAEVVVYGDTDLESDELLVVSFTNPSGARLGGFYGLSISTIVDDDWPKVVPDVVEVQEGAGDVVALVPVTLSQASTVPVTVSWETYVGAGVTNQATAGSDYTAASGTVTFLPGQTSATVAVTVRPDALVEPLELLVIRFHSPVGARLGGFYGLGVVRIRDSG